MGGGDLRKARGNLRGFGGGETRELTEETQGEFEPRSMGKYDKVYLVISIREREDHGKLIDPAATKFPYSPDLSHRSAHSRASPQPSAQSTVRPITRQLDSDSRSGDVSGVDGVTPPFVSPPPPHGGDAHRDLATNLTETERQPPWERSISRRSVFASRLIYACDTHSAGDARV